MGDYKAELLDAERQSAVAHDAVEAWLNRPSDAPDDLPAVVLETHARTLRQSRARIQAMLREQGIRDDLAAALVTNTEQHKSLGLGLPDEPDVEEMP